jgi:hypothetical protein
MEEKSKQIISCTDEGDTLHVEIKGTENDIVECMGMIIDKLDLSNDSVKYLYYKVTGKMTTEKNEPN